ncbi:MAG: hypothetical protein HY730_03095, partial [Candidatus Tectomicrobia bacterium]|nr:hypothetical protein [Candidatus Tectomicrobia bacterium]
VFVLGYILIFPALLLISCSDHATIDPKLSDQVIIEAHVINYEELSKSEQDKIGICCFYSTGGWTVGDLVRFSPEKAYYVRARINIDILARLTEANKCGTITQPARCTEEEIQTKAKALAEHSNPHMLYGKYKNSWAFTSSGIAVPKTVKFDGHRLLSINRDTVSRLDEVLIGPIPQRPDQMMIIIYSSSVNGYEPLRNPRRTMN